MSEDGHPTQIETAKHAETRTESETVTQLRAAARAGLEALERSLYFLEHNGTACRALHEADQVIGGKCPMCQARGPLEDHLALLCAVVPTPPEKER